MEVSLDGNAGFDNKRKLITNSSYRGGSIERRPTLLRHSELNDHVNTNLKDVSSDGKNPLSFRIPNDRTLKAKSSQMNQKILYFQFAIFDLQTQSFG